MAFRAANIQPAVAYNQAKVMARKVKNLAATRAAQLAAGGDANQVVQTMEVAIEVRDALASARTTPGIAAYAQEQENDGLYDVAAEFTALQNAIDTVITECVNVLPTSALGYAEVYQLDSAGNRVFNSFSSGSLAALVTALQAVDAAVV